MLRRYVQYWPRSLYGCWQMKAAIYTRVSSEMQTDGHSLDAQLSACRRLCVDRGWEIAREYTDVESARTTERPQFQQMLIDAEWHQFGVIVVHKLDRFSRSVTDTLSTLRQLDGYNVALVSISEQFDFTTPMGKVLLTMLSAFAQWYLDNLSAETSKGKRARAEQGQWNGWVPFGYSVNYIKDGGDGLPRPDPVTAPGVVMAFEQYATDQYTDREIATLLNQADYRPRARGTRGLRLWSKDSVRYMLDNRFYVGEVQHRGQWRKGQHEPIIPYEVFAAAEAVRLRRRGHRGGALSRRGRVFPLSGLARCQRCGAPMRGYSCKTTQIRYYRDPAYDQCRTCGQRLVPAQQAEDALGSFLSGLRLPQEWQAHVLHLVKQSAEAHDTEHTEGRLRNSITRLQQMYQWGHVEQGEYLSERTRLEAELAGLLPVPTPNLDRAAELLQNFSVLWDAARPSERRSILRSLLDAVYLDAEHGPVTAIQPKPDLAVLFTLTQAGTTGVIPSPVRVLMPTLAGTASLWH